MKNLCRFTTITVLTHKHWSRHNRSVYIVFTPDSVEILADIHALFAEIPQISLRDKKYLKEAGYFTVQQSNLWSKITKVHWNSNLHTVIIINHYKVSFSTLCSLRSFFLYKYQSLCWKWHMHAFLYIHLFPLFIHRAPGLKECIQQHSTWDIQ